MLVLAACDSTPAESKPTQPDTDESDASPAAADSGGESALEKDAGVYTQPLSAGEWQVMDFDARKKFMREMVMPSMRQAFQEFDSERFAAVGCKTCHGDGVSDGTFSMPANAVPSLTRAALMNPSESQQAISEFMRNVVRPQLATLLGAGADSPAPLRCSTCHAIQD